MAPHAAWSPRVVRLVDRDRHAAHRRRAGVREAAGKVSDVVLMPVAPTSMEYERTHALHRLIREHAPDAIAVALMVRAVTSAVSTAFYRRALTEDGWRVLRTTVSRRESFAQA